MSVLYIILIQEKAKSDVGGGEEEGRCRMVMPAGGAVLA